MTKKFFCFLLPLVLLFSSIAQADTMTRKMQAPAIPWLFDGDWDLFCQNHGHLVGIVDSVQHIKGKDRVTAVAVCLRTPDNDKIRTEIDLFKMELKFVKDSNFGNNKYVAYSSPPGGSNIHEVRLAQYPHPFSTYEYICPEGSLITGIETSGKTRKVLGFPVVTRKGLRFLCGKFENGNLVETSTIKVADRDANWGGSNFGKLQCPEGQAAFGIGQIWESEAINARNNMILHCLPVQE